MDGEGQNTEKNKKQRKDKHDESVNLFPVGLALVN